MKKDISILGDVHCWLEDCHGRRFNEYKTNNLVVATGKQLVAKFLGGASGIGPVTKIQVGSNGTATADGDTTITTPAESAITSVAYPSANQVQFSYNIPSATVGAMVIKEMGLVTAAGVLFARKVTPDTPVPDGLNFVGTWTITINN